MLDTEKLFECTVRSVFEITTEAGSGTGFLVRDDGLILTNAHVIYPETAVEVRGCDGRAVRCRVLRMDRRQDIAAVQLPSHAISHVGAPLSLCPLTSGSVKVGQQVMTIGNPACCSTFSCSNGHVAAVDYEINNGVGPFIQLDMSVNWGNSGGPVIDSEGSVVAMAARINFTPDGDRLERVCFGVPARAMAAFVDSIRSLENGNLASKLFCKVCGNLVEKSTYCEHCGSVLEARDSSTLGSDETEECPACRHMNPGGVEYCRRCGSMLAANEAKG
jgi:S1-C subfamily serine protease